MGEKADPSKTQSLPAGSFFVLPPGMPHYAVFDEKTVIQINTIGPWSVTYVSPEETHARPGNSFDALGWREFFASLSERERARLNDLYVGRSSQSF